MLNIFNSANPKIKNKAPESNQVHVHDNGECVWLPFSVWSISHCSMDSFWFPFDDQLCSLIFESWAERVKFTTHPRFGAHEYEFEPNDLWELVG